MAEDATIISERRGSLGVVRLNRPDQLNAFTWAMSDALKAAVKAAEADPAVTAIAITGTGRAFCSGFDASALVDVTTSGKSRDPQDPDSPAAFSHLLKIGKPVIAAINGVAAGGGVVLAAMCDMRFASDAASFTTIFSKRGLVAEHAMSWLLPRMVGPSRAMDILMSSRRVYAEEALRIGLVDRLMPGDDLLDAVQAYSDDLAANTSPHALARIKAQIYRDLSESFRSASMHAHDLTKQSLTHPDSNEGARAFVERRPPKFLPYSPT